MTPVQRRNGGRQQLPRPAQWHELAHAPWSRLDTSALQDIEAVRTAFARHRIDPESQRAPEHAQPSAVLVALFVATDGPRVLLTRRSEMLTSHKGQIAFPGGRLEAGETSLQAALRETHEEIGVDASGARVLGELSAHRTISSSSHIVPHVVELDTEPSVFALNAEVERAFSVPLAELTRPDTFRHEHWKFADREVVVPFFYLDDETIWGATARMLQELVLVTLTA
jgi:8-oxo-dGTP pyrophosphatase MutT (NUDIX family)